MEGGTPRPRPRLRGLLRNRYALVVAVVLVAAAVPGAMAAFRTSNGRSHAAPHCRPRPFGAGRRQPPVAKPHVGRREAATTCPTRSGSRSRPSCHLKKAGSAVFDVRTLKSVVVKRERPERQLPLRPRAGGRRLQRAEQVLVEGPPRQPPAPAPDSSFDGLDFANWGAGHPPDTNGDVGPNYYIQTVNTSIGIYDKSSGSPRRGVHLQLLHEPGAASGTSATRTTSATRSSSTTASRTAGSSPTSRSSSTRSGNVRPAGRVPVLRRLEDGRPGHRRLELLLDRGARRPRRLPEVRRLAGRPLHVGEHVRLRGRRRRTPATTSGRSTSSRCTPAPRRCRWSTSPATPRTSRSSRRTRGSRPARRRPARPSTSSRPSSS